MVTPRRNVRLEECPLCARTVLHVEEPVHGRPYDWRVLVLDDGGALHVTTCPQAGKLRAMPDPPPEDRSGVDRPPG